MAGIIEERDIGTLVPAMAAALEPAAMRHSMTSLLEVYLGNGPANRVAGGAFPRGAMTEIEAAVVITDLRGFTDLSERLAPDSLLQLLGGYFEVIVEAMRSEGGDVLKFMGDGVLSIFPAAGQDGGRLACVRFAESSVPLRRIRAQTCASSPPFHVGPVVYGNIGSLDRLDFTVVGPTVNFASRLETAAKQLGKPVICSLDVARELPTALTRDLGPHALKGISDPQTLLEVEISAN